VAARRHVDAQAASTEDSTRPSPEEVHETLREDDTVVGRVEATPPKAKSNEEVDMEEQRKMFTDLMRTLPHPLAIITAQPPGTEQSETSVVGATVSSFNTVSLTPDIVVSFNLTRASATYRTILDSKRFCISFPTSNKAGSELAHRFTQGNDTPPLHPDLVPSVQGLYWNGTPDSNLPNVKEGPPAVVLKDKALPTGDAGFAFALLFEYQHSLPVGDHVIVTGRFIPRQIRSSKNYGWGRQKGGGSAFATSHLVLAYAHGLYGFVDNGIGIENSWKHDDRYKWADFTTLPDLQVKNAKLLYKRRLNLIRRGKELQQGQKMLRSDMIADSVRRASELPPSRIHEMEEYYTQRLALVEERLAEEAKPKHVIATDRSDIPGWQNSLIRKKMLLSDEELKKEDALYLVRLQKLSTQVKKLEKSQLSPAGKTESQAIENEDSTTPQSAELQRLYELTEHARERLTIIREAQRRKEGVEQTIEIKKLNKYQITRFLESKRQQGYDDLKRGYRRDLYQIQEASLSLIEMESRPDTKDEAAIKQLKDRIDYYTETSQLLAGLIAERIAHADPMELNAKIKRPHVGINGPPPIPEPRTPRKKKNHDSKVAVSTRGVSGVRDEDGNWKFSDITKIGAVREEKSKQKARRVVLAHENPHNVVIPQDLQEMHASQVNARHTHAEGGREESVRDDDGHDALVTKHFESEEIPVWPNHEKKE